MPIDQDGHFVIHPLLRKNRTDLGYTQEYVSECCDITPREYQNLESGRAKPSFITAIRLSIVLQFSLDDLKQEIQIRKPPLPTPR